MEDKNVHALRIMWLWEHSSQIHTRRYFIHSCAYVVNVFRAQPRAVRSLSDSFLPRENWGERKNSLGLAPLLARSNRENFALPFAWRGNAFCAGCSPLIFPALCSSRRSCASALSRNSSARLATRPERARAMIRPSEHAQLFKLRCAPVTARCCCSLDRPYILFICSGLDKNQNLRACPLGNLHFSSTSPKCPSGKWRMKSACPTGKFTCPGLYIGHGFCRALLCHQSYS